MNISERYFSFNSDKLDKQNYVLSNFGDVFKEDNKKSNTESIEHANNIIKNNETKKIIFVEYNFSVFFINMKRALKNICDELDINFFWIRVREFRKLKNIDNSIVIFIMHPDYYMAKCHRIIKKRNNIFVVWNFEPLIEHIPRYKNRYDCTISMLDKKLGDIDYFFLHDLKQTEHFSLSYNNCYFLPFGYYNRIKPNIEYKRNKGNNLCFLGSVSKNRSDFASHLFNHNINIALLDGANFSTYDRRMQELFYFNIGVDIHAHPDLVGESISWMRTVYYASFDMITVTNCNLDAVGFKDKKDYFFFNNWDDAVDIIIQIDNDMYDLDKMVQRSRDKIIKNLNMLNMFMSCLNKIDSNLLNELQKSKG